MGFLDEATNVLTPLNITPQGTYLIIVFTIIAIIIGFTSMLLISLNNKEGKFAKYTAYEKLIFSFFIGGPSVYVALAFYSLLSAMGWNSISSESAILVLTFFASYVSASILDILVIKSIDFSTVIRYFGFMISLGAILSLLVLEALIWNSGIPLKTKAFGILFFGILLVMFGIFALNLLKRKSRYPLKRKYKNIFDRLAKL